MGRLAERAFAPDALRRAWLDVLANDRADGELGHGVARFEERADEELALLTAELAWGAYEPGDLAEVVLEASRRLLHIPRVRDRVVERAVLEVVTPLVDPVLGPAAYAYRPGLGVADAVQAVVGLRAEGLTWVLRTDIDDCFPSTPVALARRRFGALVDDPELLRVVDLLLARMGIAAGRGRRVVRGLAQGCALSPLLSNLVLVDVDSALLREGFSVVRYADDILVAAETQSDAWEAARCASRACEELGMELGADKTAVLSFADGFAFLGEEFGPRYPPLLPDFRVGEPERRTLYAATQGGRVRIQSGRLIVEDAEDAEQLDVPSGLVGRIVCFGSVGLSAGARSWALSNDVDIVFASRRGTYLGSFVGAGTTRAARLRSQLAVTGTDQALRIGRAIVEAKIRKQIVVLQRFGRREHAELVTDAIRRAEHSLLMLPDCRTVDEVMGMEGAAAAAYFPAYGGLLPEGLRFETRSRQPPMDVANSALSFLYTILLGECVTALYAAGLDPHLGVLHADHEDRPSLALDLVEEFRPLVVDQVVLEAARQGRLTTAHGRVEDGRTGVMLTQAGREAVIDGYEKRMLRDTKGALPGFAGSIRRHVYRQAQRLRAAILDRESEWSGLSWR